MRALKTIVATAVIVFTLTAVATAGVQHFTSQHRQTSGAQAQATQPTYTITMTAAQLRALFGTQGNGAAKADRNAQRDQHQDQMRDRDATRTTTRDHDATQARYVSGSGQNGTGTCVPHDYDHDHDWGGSGDGDHSGDGQHHSGDSDCR